MADENNSELKRSISMPTQPQFLERRSLERSEEKEELFSTNYVNQIEELDENEEPNLEREENDIIHHENHSKAQLRKSYKSDINSPISNSKRVNSPCIYQDSNPFVFRTRIIDQTGDRNISFINIPQRSWHFFKDFVTTLIEVKMKYIVMLFISSYFAVFFFCASIWYLIAYAHGDLFFDVETGEQLVEGAQPCVTESGTFLKLFLYTVEATTSTGFGDRTPTDECPEAVFFFGAQLVIYVGIEGMLASIVYSKISRPSRKVSSPKFSKRAVVCRRNGKHCLVVRVCDRQSQQTIGSKITMYLLQNRSTLEGEFLQKSQIELKLEDNGTPFLLWPTTICHVIDKTSPFYKYAAEDFARMDYEIVVSCTGSSPSTAQVTECITSYLPTEVYWGERFVNIIDYDWTRQAYAVDYDSFHTTVSVGMPVYSAHQLYRIVKNAKKNLRKSIKVTE